MRVVGSILWERDAGLEQLDEIKRLRKEYTAGRVDARTVKIHQDGLIENYTAAMLEPYLLPGDVRGIAMVDPERLKEIVTRLDAEGFQVHFHAIGDAAIRQALDAVQAARNANGDLGHRHHISHLELIDPADIPRFRELGVIANFQPQWAHAEAYITDLTIPFLGPKRSEWLYPIGSVYRSGAIVAFGSDWSVSTANPFVQIETAVTRMGALGETNTPFLPAERINLPEAIAAFTTNAAYTNRMERDTGSVEVGKLADLVVLDRNPFDIPTSEISDARRLSPCSKAKSCTAIWARWPARPGNSRARGRRTVVATTGNRTRQWWTRVGLEVVDGRLWFAGHDAEKLAREHGTPLFVYDPRRLEANVARLVPRSSAPVCVTGSTMRSRRTGIRDLLATLRALGDVGLDVCSPNEVTLALESGWRPAEISYTGTNLSERDLDVILAQPLILNLDSLSAIRRVGRRAPGRAIGLRINPQVGTGYSAQLTYAGEKPTKFGIYADRFDEALALAREQRLDVRGLHFHIGSGWLRSGLATFSTRVQRGAELARRIPGIEYVNVGGGLGIALQASERTSISTRTPAASRGISVRSA